jgi:phosphoribosylaminoimidazolecarboxamide formyltransferase/IMP cyclohydrolase
MKRALLSLFDKDGAETFAAELVKRGFEIISSGGTAKYLSEHGIEVTDISKITGHSPVLGHRVVTLAPQIHGPLLATPAMRPELDSLGWVPIDLLYVTFYPLEQELERDGSTFESCLEKTDIGGPTMIRSANKGGNVIVMTDVADEGPVLDWLDKGMPDRSRFLYSLRASAELAVSDYIRLSAEVYRKFAHMHR